MHEESSTEKAVVFCHTATSVGFQKKQIWTMVALPRGFSDTYSTSSFILSAKSIIALQMLKDVVAMHGP